MSWGQSDLASLRTFDLSLSYPVYSASSPLGCSVDTWTASFQRGFGATWDKKERRKRHSTPVLLPGKSHGERNLVGYSPWGHWESDTTERLHFLFLLSCIGEGNGNPLQCSCLENPRDGGAWWAAVYGVTQSWTRLKWLSSSSSSRNKEVGLASRAATTLWELVEEGTSLSCHSREIAPGMEMSRRKLRFLVLQQWYCYNFWLCLFPDINYRKGNESFKMKKVALVLKQQGLEENRNEPGILKAPAWTCKDGDGTLRPEGNRLLRQMCMGLTMSELRKLKGEKAEKNRSQAAVDYPVQVDCLTILRPVKPVLRKLGVTFPIPPPPIIWWKQQDSSRTGWAGDLCGDHWKSEDSLHYRIGHDNRPLYLLRNRKIPFHSLKTFYYY